MANPHRGAVALETAEATYTLRLTTNAVCEMEDALGKPIMAIVDEMQGRKGVGMKAMRAIVWACLLDGQPGVTQERAGEILDEAGMDLALTKVGEAMQAFFPTAKGAKGASNPR